MNKQDKRVVKNCENCGIEMLIPQWRIKKNKNLFCSHKCYGIWKIEWFKNHPEIKEKIRLWATGRKQSTATIEKRVSKIKGVKRTEEQKILMRKNIPRGVKSSSWKGGKSPISYRIRRNVLFKEWREKVFKRDNWTCQTCQARGGELHPHHIKFLSVILDEIFLKTKIYEEIINYKELWEVDNGVTLCKICHKDFHRQVA